MASHARTLATFTFALLLLAGLAGCKSASRGGTRDGVTTRPIVGVDAATARRGLPVNALRGEPGVRVRIVRSATQVQLASAGQLTVGPSGEQPVASRASAFAGPLSIHHDRSGFVITDGRGQSVRWGLGALLVTSTSGTVQVDSTRYPDAIALVAVVDDSGRATGRIDVVNHVGMERYLPGVLSRELYASWDEKAYRAQAIAARSYAIWEMNLPHRRASHYDLEAGQASQAYLGLDASDKARSAVQATRGLVLVFDNRVLPAFYSSCSGGTGQDAAAVFPEKVDDLAPLRGREHGGWAQQSEKFRWGPVTYPNARLMAAMVRWGSANEHPIRGMTGGVRDIQTIAHNRVGRPARFAVTDGHNRRYELHAEQLRQAANFAVPGDPEGAQYTLFSSHVEVHVTPQSVTFTGRGYGHGVGMCQWGAQGMAQHGYDPIAILNFYYPGAVVYRAY
ncbi:MAG: SpoIID/LytB domain-containing protein [Phycisphaerales bacterium JB063]